MTAAERELTAEEIEEMEKIPKKYRPLTTGKMLLQALLFIVPIFGQIYCICLALFSKNVSLRSYARGMIGVAVLDFIFDTLVTIGLFVLMIYAFAAASQYGM
jgi:hypothetical protein